jgi:hypothetical protein
MAGNVAPNTVKNGLVLYLDAANTKSYISGSTAWNDVSRTGLNGTLTNGPIFNTGSGGNIVFDGTNDFVNLSSTAYNLGVNFTLQLWVRIGRFGGGPFNGSQNRASLISNSFTYASNTGFLLMATSQGTAGQGFVPTVGQETFFFTMGSDQYVMAPQPGVLASYRNSWVNLTAIVNGTSPMRGYINGIEISSYAAQSNGPSALTYSGAPFVIGHYGNQTEFLSGSIGNVSVYNRALSAQEILQNYNGTKGRYGL